MHKLVSIRYIPILLALTACTESFQAAHLSAPTMLSAASSRASLPTVSPQPTPISSPAPSGSTHILVPIYQTQQTTANGAPIIRQSIFVTVGNSAPIEALFDTGSTGLRILRGVLNASDYSDTGQATVYTFGAGQLTGTIGSAVVSIGGVKTPQPIAFQVVTSIGCPADKPDCAFSHSDSSIFGVGSTGQGFKAIIGVSMKDDVVPNPLTELTTHSWIIDLGVPAVATPGSLILRPDATDIAGFTAFQLSRQASGSNGSAPLWADNQMPGCLVNLDSTTSVCYGTSIDTGAFNFRTIPAPTQGIAWANGTHASLNFKNDSGETVRIPFTVGSGLGTGVFLASDNTAVRNMNVGPLPMFSHLVMYDFDRGVIGLKAK